MKKGRKLLNGSEQKILIRLQEPHPEVSNV
jgi:hypothetical protein